MKRLPLLARDRCAILPLVMKGRWFDMIERGEKRVEFRRVDYWLPRVQRWRERAVGGRLPVVEMRRGYGADAPRLAFVCGRLHDPARGWRRLFEPFLHLSAEMPVRHPELGEEQVERIAILLGERVEIAPAGRRAKAMPNNDTAMTQQ